MASWIFRDGSYLVLDSAHHRRFIEEFLGKKEYDMERYLVKVSLYKVHTHNNMTNKQWDTVCKFSNKYQLREQKVEELD